MQRGGGAKRRSDNNFIEVLMKHTLRAVRLNRRSTWLSAGAASASARERKTAPVMGRGSYRASVPAGAKIARECWRLEYSLPPFYSGSLPAGRGGGRLGAGTGLFSERAKPRSYLTSPHRISPPDHGADSCLMRNQVDERRNCY